jgi:hypothetical protein
MAAIAIGMLFMAAGLQNTHGIALQPQEKPSEQRKPPSRTQRLKNWLRTKLGIQKESQQELSSSTIVEQSAAVLKLPTEVLVRILEYLPASSATAFTFTCKQTYQRLDRTYSSILMEHSGEKFAYLNLLARDLPDQVSCQLCGRLHEIADARWYANYYTGPHSLYDDSQQYEHPDDVRRNLGDNFNILVFRMAMKQYKLGLNYDQLLQVISSVRAKPKILSDLVIRKRTDCTIFRGFMIQRVQSAFINMTWKTIKESHQSLQFFICSHIILESSKTSLCIFTYTEVHYKRKSLWSRRWYKDTTDQKTLKRDELEGSGLRQCPYCWTECRIDLDYSPDYGLVVACTRWKNLGKEPQVSDRIWGEHLKNVMSITPRQRECHSRVLKSSSLDSGPLAVAFGNDEEEMLVQRNHRNDILDMQLRFKSSHEAQEYRRMLKLLKPTTYCPE